MTCARACAVRFRYDSLMFVRLQHLLGWVISVFRSREELLLENLALRQQLLALHAKRPRPRLSSVDRLFWILVDGDVERQGNLLCDSRTAQTALRWSRACPTLSRRLHP